uniref:AAA+ ATPase domain-containing protein n=1 Tax=Polytomella parva TaxID=51329 RepID=A0A7S0YS76_9CHLO|mmetsp:Transcript_6960/g.13683  ORF Transcript_6960/g.13683 Transcript_6960/m.13683 type:complete len:352 (+) Transcript_6960:141-1196(+)
MSDTEMEDISEPSASKTVSPSPDVREMPWVEKYRPKTLDDVSSHKEVIDTIKRLTSENRLPHLLFYGPPGTGKTSTVLAIARQLYGSAVPTMTLELNASDERGIQVVRQQVQDFASTKTVFSSQSKLVILDECDAMTNDAQFALRRVIEKYTRNARFCLICNYVSKVIPALQSRCTRFRFPPLSTPYVAARVREIADMEGLRLSKDGLEAVVVLGGGDMRRTLNILQACHMAFPKGIDELAVYQCTGQPLPADVRFAFQTLLSDSVEDAFRKIVLLQVEKGLALSDLVRELHPILFECRSLSTKIKATLVERLADVEYYLAGGASERLQLGGLVAAFIIGREDIVAAAARV